MMFTYKSRFLTRAEVWYDNEPSETRRVDWVLYQQWSQPIPGTKSSFFYTYAIDLALKPDQLLANLSKDTAYKIRRARDRDRIVCEICDPRDPAAIAQFELMYNAFAAIKGRPLLNRARMESMAAAGVLDLSVAKDPQGNALVYHANYRGSGRATSLESPSLYRKLSSSADRNLVSRANRLLTWNNLLRYQEQGLKSFDFGGWYPGVADQTRLDINRFKEGFGGQIVREFQCEQILTLKGWLMLTAADLLSLARHAVAGPRHPFTPAYANALNGSEGGSTQGEEESGLPVSSAATKSLVAHGPGLAKGGLYDP
jgi:hypothetical protein